MKKILVALTTLLVLSGTALAEPTENDVKRLRELQQNIVILERVGANDLVPAQFQQVSEIAGEEITTKDQLAQYLLQHDKTGGFFTFLNIVWFLASLICIIALSWLCFVYMGAYAIEFMGYVVCVLGLVSGLIWSGLGIWFVVPACLLLFALLMLTEKLHFKDFDKRRKYDSDEGQHQLKPGSGWLSFSLYQVQFAILTVVYGGAALLYNSQVLGFMTIMALEGLLGFTMLVGPLCIGLGFNSEKVIPRATAASFMILLVYLLTRISGDPGIFHVFQGGAFFIGTFVYFLGLLILSSWYYYAWNRRGQEKGAPAQFWLMQVVTIASGCAAFYVGSVFGINTLLGVGGTLFVIYLMEKYTELPWTEIGFAWGLLGAGLLLFGFALFAYHHPQYFFLGAG